MEKVKIGIIICDRYRTCAGGKCFRAVHNREGAFARYKGQEVEIAAFTTCGGCPGGNIEYAPEEMKKNGVTHIHFATGFIVGYPPCPYMEYFRDFIVEKYGMEVVFGTHPIPQKYYATHGVLNTWKNLVQKGVLDQTLTRDRCKRQLLHFSLLFKLKKHFLLFHHVQLAPTLASFPQLRWGNCPIFG